MYGIILAGGSGSRLWPLSRELYPKQLLSLNSDKSLLQTTFERLNLFLPADKILSVTNTKHAANVKMQLDKKSPVLAEPVSKNTAPAIAVSVKYLVEKTNSDPIVLVMPSDLQINDDEKFQDAVNNAVKFVQDGYIVTFGIRPSYAETGFGYIKTDGTFRVEKFIEKPDEKQALEYLQSGGYFWNSGIFMFKASVILEEIQKLAPEISNILNRFDFASSESVPFTEFDKMPNISIDYAVMEKSDKIAMIELKSDWKDLGSWQSIYDVSKKDDNGNVFVGHVLDKDSKGSLVYASSKLVSTIGLEDTVIVETAPCCFLYSIHFLIFSRTFGKNSLLPWIFPYVSGSMLSTEILKSWIEFKSLDMSCLSIASPFVFIDIFLKWFFLYAYSHMSSSPSCIIGSPMHAQSASQVRDLYCIASSIIFLYTSKDNFGDEACFLIRAFNSCGFWLLQQKKQELLQRQLVSIASIVGLYARLF